MSLQLNGTDGVTFNDGSEQWAAASPIGTKNLIINGNMQIAQRGTSSSSYSSGDTYLTLDRWRSNLSSAGTWTMSQDTDVPSGQGFATSMKWDCTTANGSLSAGSYMYFTQYFEGQNLQHLKKGTSSAESLTVSFWVKSNKTGTYTVFLYDVDNTRLISKSYTIDTADTWEKKTITFAGDTSGVLDNDNARSFDIRFMLVAGTDWSSGTLQTSWAANVTANRAVGQVNLADNTSNYINITGVQLEVGDTATPFEHRPYDMELARCQRYYYKYKPNVNSSGVCAGLFFTSGGPLYSFHYKFPMRANPTFSYSALSDFNIVKNGAAGNPTNLVATGLSTEGCRLDITFSGTAGDGSIMQTSGTSSYLDFSAEL